MVGGGGGVGGFDFDYLYIFQDPNLFLNFAFCGEGTEEYYLLLIIYHIISLKLKIKYKKI